MPTVIPVKFAYAARDLWFDPGQTDAQEGDLVICVTVRGTVIGLVSMDAVEMDDGRLRATIGDATLKPVLRIASEADLGNAERLAAMGERAFPVFRRLVAESGLDMKPVGVEYLFGGEKVVCYFSAEERVDFRQLVRDLSRELHERIDMRQIGVREEAAIIGGFARCGQELCCARFGRQFEPVSIRMAKEQNLPLNSTKISGACGRLMCCLRYEYQTYRELRRGMPRIGETLDLPEGQVRVVAVNLGRCSLKVEHPEEGTYEVPPERVKALGLGVPLPAPAAPEAAKSLPAAARRAPEPARPPILADEEAPTESTSEGPRSRPRTGSRASRRPQEHSHPPARPRREAPAPSDPPRPETGSDPSVSRERPTPPSSRKRPRKGRSPQSEASAAAGQPAKRPEKRRPRRGSGRTKPADQTTSTQSSASEESPGREARPSGRGRRRGRDRRPGGRRPGGPAPEKPPGSA